MTDTMIDDMYDRLDLAQAIRALSIQPGSARDLIDQGMLDSARTLYIDLVPALAKRIEVLTAEDEADPVLVDEAMETLATVIEAFDELRPILWPSDGD